MSLDKGFVLWLTGLSGSGKTTIGILLEEALLERGIKAELLDGDQLRAVLSQELGFTREERDMNIARIGFVAGLLSRNGIAAIVSAISPYRDIREKLREKTENFVEVFVDCPLEICAGRDVKGLYKKAIAGEIPNFTGISDPYEKPENPEIVVDTSTLSIEESVEKIIAYLEKSGLVPKLGNNGPSLEEKGKISKSLAQLGYI